MGHEAKEKGPESLSPLQEYMAKDLGNSCTVSPVYRNINPEVSHCAGLAGLELTASVS